MSEEVLARLREDDLVVVLLDVMMPGRECEMCAPAVSMQHHARRRTDVVNGDRTRRPRGSVPRD